jgi:hypothetical protein
MTQVEVYTFPFLLLVSQIEFSDLSLSALGANNMEKTLESKIQSWKQYKYASNISDTAAFDQLMYLLELNKVVANYSETITPFDPIIMSILFRPTNTETTTKIDAILVATLQPNTDPKITNSVSK